MRLKTQNKHIKLLNKESRFGSIYMYYTLAINAKNLKKRKEGIVKMNTIHKEKMGLKILKRISIFLVFALVIGLFHTQTALAKKKGYKVVDSYDDGISIVKKGKKYGVINNDKIIIPISYDGIDRTGYSSDTFFIKKGWKWGIINKSNKVLIPTSYSDIGIYNEKLYRVAKKNKWGDQKYGIINRKNKVVLAFKYDNIGYYDEEYDAAEVIKSGKYGYLNEKGKLVIPCEYEETNGFAGDIARVERTKP